MVTHKREPHRRRKKLSNQISLMGVQVQCRKELKMALSKWFPGHREGARAVQGAWLCLGAALGPFRSFCPKSTHFLLNAGFRMCPRDATLCFYHEVLWKKSIHRFKPNQTLPYRDTAAVSCWMICPVTAKGEANEKWEECAGHLSSHISQCGFETVCFLNFLRSMVTGDGCHHMCSFGKIAMVRL